MPVAIFAAVIDALFADPHLAINAIYCVSGADPGVPVRVIVRRHDQVGELGETRIVAGTVMIDVRVSEVGTPADGDSIEAESTVYIIQGEPIRDAERLVWIIEARPA